MANSEKIHEAIPAKRKKFSDADYSKLIETDLFTGFRFLCQLLHMHFGKRVMVFTDEYDFAMRPNKISKLQPSEIEYIFSFFEGIFPNTLKGNEYLKKELLTGVLSIFMECSTNSIILRSFSNREYCKYYGFVEQKEKANKAH